MKPFLRWAGGKRWLARELSVALTKVLSTSRGTFFEPFLGSGAMFFSIVPQKSILSDLNSSLIETYSSVRESSNKIQQLMQKWKVDKETYYNVRELESSCRFEQEETRDSLIIIDICKFMRYAIKIVSKQKTKDCSYAQICKDDSIKRKSGISYNVPNLS